MEETAQEMFHRQEGEFVAKLHREIAKKEKEREDAIKKIKLECAQRIDALAEKYQVAKQELEEDLCRVRAKPLYFEEEARIEIKFSTDHTAMQMRHRREEADLREKHRQEKALLVNKKIYDREKLVNQRTVEQSTLVEEKGKKIAELEIKFEDDKFAERLKRSEEEEKISNVLNSEILTLRKKLIEDVDYFRSECARKMLEKRNQWQDELRLAKGKRKRDEMSC